MRSRNFARHAVPPLSKPNAAYIINWSNVNGTLKLAVIMDAIWFQQTLERAGASHADLARHLRLAPSAVSRMMKGERQMKLLEAVQIAAFLGVSQDEVLRHAGASAETVPRAGPARRGRPPRAFAAPVAPPRAEPIPIRSAARGGADQQMFLEDGPIGYTPRPA